MKNLIDKNPLLSPISFNGGTYFTSHYFHAQYKNNAGGKYSQLKDFNRLVRSIETYNEYVLNSDIIEIQSKSDIPTEAQLLHLAYKSNNYAPIMLINATAQVALTHHLDDAISKAVSVEVNSSAMKKTIMNPQILATIQALEAIDRLEQEQARIASVQKEQDESIKKIEARQHAIINGEDYFCVTAYAKLHNIDVDAKTANVLGRKSAAYCRDNGILKSQVSHPLYGVIGAYPSHVLDNIFDKHGI